MENVATQKCGKPERKPETGKTENNFTGPWRAPWARPIT